MRILALTKYGPMAASTRQRFLQYRPALAAAGMQLDVSPLLGDDHLRRLVEGRRASPVGVAAAYARRLRTLLTARRYDLLWVHCELFPYLPGLLERLAFAWGRPVVFDFDDAIFAMYDEARSLMVRELLGGKLEPLVRGAAACLCGNPYLRDYAARSNPNSIVLPTVVDTDRYVPAVRREGPLTIGWIGSPSTWANVRPLLPLLRRLVEERGVRVRVVGAGVAAEADAFRGLELVPWTEATEIVEVQGFDIGIMPLVDGPFERGKSGYKLIQYMACGLAVVGSPVGVNSEIVTPEVGLLAADEGQWEQALGRLIDDADLRRRLGAAGRDRAVTRYSLASQAPRLIALFREVLGSR